MTNLSVYIFRKIDTDEYKIGLSSNVGKRISTISSTYKCKVEYVYAYTWHLDNMIFTKYWHNNVLGAYLEKWIHFKLRDKNIKGEWFKLSDSDLEKAIDLLENNKFVPYYQMGHKIYSF